MKLYRAIVERFVQLHGDLAISQITRNVIQQHRMLLAQLPSSGAGVRKMGALERIQFADANDLPRLSNATIKNGLTNLGSILAVAVGLG